MDNPQVCDISLSRGTLTFGAKIMFCWEMNGVDQLAIVPWIGCPCGLQSISILTIDRYMEVIIAKRQYTKVSIFGNNAVYKH